MSDNSSPPPWGRMRMTLTQAEDGRSKEAERRGQGVNGVYTRWQSPGPDSSLPTASLSLSIATSAMLERRLRGGNSLGPPSGSPISLLESNQAPRAKKLHSPCPEIEHGGGQKS
ncbi:hypothetical protein H109_07451 [Trichophyton interdigitale MR816]|uniref:Uncharacterized protein n=1 Tax=Trichophyton interdigitale (strain MR816) TaxID=1215338 RepID=A0A059IYB5_TRIIM|nr:hypothetical protein H101_08009 [Trichophyton interdigitale H6]KDB20595.1 hypothetical protein H109_07451 [Trichophyton interdigitale MR816]